MSYEVIAIPRDGERFVRAGILFERDNPSPKIVSDADFARLEAESKRTKIERTTENGKVVQRPKKVAGLSIVSAKKVDAEPNVEKLIGPHEPIIPPQPPSAHDMMQKMVEGMAAMGSNRSDPRIEALLAHAETQKLQIDVLTARLNEALGDDKGSAKKPKAA